MQNNRTTYKLINAILLVGMVMHLLIIHPFEEGWMLCGDESNVHLENVNLINDCHSQTEEHNEAHNNCEDDVKLDHQDEYFSNNNISVIKALPVNKLTTILDLTNQKITLCNFTNADNEITDIPLSIKSSIQLLI